MIKEDIFKDFNLNNTYGCLIGMRQFLNIYKVFQVRFKIYLMTQNAFDGS